MKKILSIAALGLVSSSLYAGPIVTSPEPRLPSASNTWTGFYIGGSAGYTRSQIDPALGLSGGFNQLPPFLTDGLEARGSEDFGFNGGELGGLLGFNYQMGPVVLGLETAGSYLWSRDARDTGAFVLGQGVPPLEVRSSFKTHHLFTVAPRIGFAFGRVMPYVTGGLAVGDLDYFQELSVVGAGTTHSGGRISETNAGWMVGGGLEYALTDHWHARAQYQYVDLGSAGFGAEVTTSPGFFTRHDAQLIEHHATFALIYKF